MGNRLLLFLLITVMPLASLAQFTMEGYLANSVSDEELQYVKSKQAFLDQNKFNSPILREVEFRARIRTFGDGFEDYRLRFSPLNPFEKKANKDFQKALNEHIDSEYRMNLEEVLLSRYLLMIEHLELSKKISLLEESATFYSRMLAITQNSSSSPSLKDYIQLDKAHLETILDLDEAKQNRQLIEQTIKYTYSFEVPISWNYNDIIDIPGIQNWLGTQNPSLQNNLYLKNELEKESLQALEYRIEKNESFRNLGYVQAEYRKDADRSFGENLGMQIAVNVPIVNPDKPDLQRDKLELFEDSKKLEIEKKELERYMEKHYARLQARLMRYNTIVSKEATYDKNNFNSTSNNNAMELMIELHKFRSELKELKIKTEAEILSLYIEALSLNGQLSEQPYVNYLSQARSPYTIDY